MDKELIRDIRCIERKDKGWYQYNILLDIDTYRYKEMLDWAYYLVDVDLEIQSIFWGDEPNLIVDFKNKRIALRDYDKIKNEKVFLSIGGQSKFLGGEFIRVCWYNQSNTLCLITLTKNEDLVRTYAKTLINKNFETKKE